MSSLISTPPRIGHFSIQDNCPKTPDGSLNSSTELFNQANEEDANVSFDPLLERVPRTPMKSNLKLKRKFSVLCKSSPPATPSERMVFQGSAEGLAALLGPKNALERSIQAISAKILKIRDDFPLTPKKRKLNKMLPFTPITPLRNQVIDLTAKKESTPIGRLDFSNIVSSASSIGMGKENFSIESSAPSTEMEEENFNSDRKESMGSIPSLFSQLDFISNPMDVESIIPTDSSLETIHLNLDSLPDFDPDVLD